VDHFSSVKSPGFQVFSNHGWRGPYIFGVAHRYVWSNSVPLFGVMQRKLKRRLIALSCAVNSSRQARNLAAIGGSEPGRRTVE
jgi:hypothetical protein